MPPPRIVPSDDEIRHGRGGVRRRRPVRFGPELRVECREEVLGDRVRSRSRPRLWLRKVRDCCRPSELNLPKLREVPLASASLPRPAYRCGRVVVRQYDRWPRAARAWRLARMLCNMTLVLLEKLAWTRSAIWPHPPRLLQPLAEGSRRSRRLPQSSTCRRQSESLHPEQHY